MANFTLPISVERVWISKAYGANDGQRATAWTMVQPWLTPRGYTLESAKEIEHRAAYFNQTHTPSESIPRMPAEHLLPASDPFLPQSGEALAYATLGYRGVQWVGPTFVSFGFALTE